VLQYYGMVQVVAAILEQDGRILIGQRTPQQSHPLKWEFPGGKVEPEETPEMAVVRELEEELGIQTEAASEMARYQFAYPGKKPIELIFFRIGSYQGEIANRIFNDLRWAPKESLANVDFLEGDRDFIRDHYTGAYEDSHPGTVRE
jgi:8-oxo-dGTP diphosphatase